jgi:hypothetical protein
MNFIEERQLGTPAVGQFQTRRSVRAKSALLSAADIRRLRKQVRFVPRTEVISLKDVGRSNAFVPPHDCPNPSLLFSE